MSLCMINLEICLSISYLFQSAAGGAGDASVLARLAALEKENQELRKSKFSFFLLYP